MKTPPDFDTRSQKIVAGEFLTLEGERHYAIRNVDELRPFLISVVSSDDHWLFASSTGGLTAGRVSPESALFPYIAVDKVHESISHTGSRTILRVSTADGPRVWEPLHDAQPGLPGISRNLYKNLLGNKLCFEEINHELGLAFRYTWSVSASYGFVRHCELENLGDESVAIEMIDGLQNILPAGTPSQTQAIASNLVNAYRWTELDAATGLAIFALYSRITDRAEPSESLRANTVFSVGLEDSTILLSSAQMQGFRSGQSMEQKTRMRGIRGAFLVNASVQLAPRSRQEWLIVADLEKSQSEVVALRQRILAKDGLAEAIARSVDEGSDALARMMAAADGLQVTAEETVSTHHYANVLFNSMRGGIPSRQYEIQTKDFARMVRHFNRPLFERHAPFLNEQADTQDITALKAAVRTRSDNQLERLSFEYLPFTFGRRHGDPSRPWNRFSIRLKDRDNTPLLAYEGNWRDIFQNWEALAFSYPEFIESMISKFVNASTMDGYNPYRITDQGVDWELEDPEDPWSYIGYWGDHQIIYLQKLLELSEAFHPERLRELLRQRMFSYANVPYRIKPFEEMLDDPKSTVTYDYELGERIEQRIAQIGADGKMVLDTDGEVHLVNLLEKLLVPLFCKLGNLVVDGGIWLNTQRPEWNDANNALVGHGLSMVTLYYMRRYVRQLQRLLEAENEPIELSEVVGDWLGDTGSALGRIKAALDNGPMSAAQRLESLKILSGAASRYREAVYRHDLNAERVTQSLEEVSKLLEDALAVIDHCISTNRREDGLYHAYNLLDRGNGEIRINRLYSMLEGQVAALSAGSIAPQDACDLLEALFDSDIYRADQKSFMLYPDRDLPGFLEKNRIPADALGSIALARDMLAAGDERVVVRDAEGQVRFNADFRNVGDLNARLDALMEQYGDAVEAAREPFCALYEKVFNHHGFTGRSGTMFGFEGLGCIYWHMVTKLMLAVQENFFAALARPENADACQRLGAFYYRIREGIGFNKSPTEYGAFPTDPYSHTPGHAGARQPGMTGQVKEEILSRFGELGLRVHNGRLQIRPDLLRSREFAPEPSRFRYLDLAGDWQAVDVPANGLAFTWCQVPIVYVLDEQPGPAITLAWRDRDPQELTELTVQTDICTEFFERSGRIRQMTVRLNPGQLFTA